MKRNDIKALHTQSAGELLKKLTALVSEIAQARLEKKVGRLTNSKKVSSLAKDIARIKTVLTEKEMEANV